MPEGITLGPSTMDFITAKCPRNKAFIVTDEFSQRYASRVGKVMKARDFTIEVWAKCLPEAPLENVLECSQAMTAFEPDLIVALGGGSVMDGAKGAWILYERPDISDLGMITPLELLGLRKKAIMAAIPTTSGTGSECTAVAVIHDTDNHRKIPIANADLLPDFAILVPEFTTSMPPDLTVGTGLDVLAHSMDAVVSLTSNDLTDAISLTAIKMVFEFLPRAFKNGKDLEARRQMLMAATTAGMGFGNSGAALTHSFGHSIGSLFNVHHGLIVGMFIPPTFQFYRGISDKYLKICDALNIPKGDKNERLDGLVEKVRDLFRELNVPRSLKELDIPWEEFEANMEKLVTHAHEDIDTIFSPRPITREQCELIYRHAYDGTNVSL